MNISDCVVDELIMSVRLQYGWFTLEKQNGEFQRFSRDCIFVKIVGAALTTVRLGFFCLGLEAKML